MEKVNIAIVTSDTLSYLGVKKLLEDIPAVTVCHIADAAVLFAASKQDSGYKR